MFPDDGRDAETLLRHADAAMYRAKQESATYAFHHETPATEDPARLTLVAELRRAMEQREFVLRYQPKAIMQSGEVRAVEALLRWNHPERGWVGPDEFIPTAQETSLIRPSRSTSSTRRCGRGGSGGTRAWSCRSL
jgi:predicted signal transduction protein with EAL and GGDEF domain